ncbi:hypothetical protein [Phormidium tenue]|uniref:hypothetical protein n=1 Tax=Phormidium tenue TaxID=126344 RepID=UPI000AB88A01|nr:hypothetical protein [Phormidium tenue]MBD2232923.1 hypothetical protein [Phormidium tenue FACHB-1052]
MKLLPRSALVASIVAAGLLSAVGSGTAYSGCALSNWGDSGISSSDAGPSGFWVASTDSNALGVALGGLGAIVALLSGGTLLMRQRWQAQAVATLDAAVDLSLITETETVLVSEPAEIESEVALAYRR